jgi:serine/threonine protein kinase/Flp pilus assembly protein TadD
LAAEYAYQGNTYEDAVMPADPRRVKDLFVAALELPDAAARRAFLDRECGDDADLRQRLDALLAAHDDPNSALNQPLAASPPDLTGACASPAETVGTVIAGKYKLLQEIGEGGMGSVFMADQLHPVKRRVAVKIIKAGMDSARVLARFEAERQALALMDHPNIAKVLDAGATATNRPFFVMELVKGVPLTDFSDRHKLPMRDRLNLFMQVCSAVQHSHQKGIIHRDLKPTNILVESHDGKPVPKVIDFGLAKATTGVPLTEHTLFTALGTVAGTPLYMAPEQATFNAIDVDTRADIYALGVILYELLTGTTPIERATFKKAAFDEMLRVIREQEPPTPSSRISSSETKASVAAVRGMEPAKLGRFVKGELDWIVMKALSKDRDRRYETANGFAKDIERFLNHEPVLAHPPSALYRLRKFARRHKAGLWTAAAATLVLVAAASGGGWVLWDRSAQDRVRRVELAGRMAETEKMVTMALAKSDQSAARAGRQRSTTSVEAHAALVDWREADAALAKADAVLTTGAATDGLRERVAEMRQRIESGRTQAQRKEKLFRDLDEARLARSVWVDNNFDFVGSSAKYAAAFADYDLDLAGKGRDELGRRLRAAEPEVREVLLVALLDWAFAAGRAGKASLSADLRTLVRAADNDPWRQRFFAATDQAALRDLSAEARRSSVPPSTLILLSLGLEFLGERDEALAVLRFGRRRHPTDFWLHYELGEHLLAVPGRTALAVEEAIGCFRVALALRPAAGLVHSELAFALSQKNNQLEEVIAELRKAIDLGSEDALVHNNLGSALQATNQLDDAIAEFNKAISIDAKLSVARFNLGLVLIQKSRFAEAKMSAQQALKLLSDNHPLRPRVVQQLQRCEGLLLLEAKLAEVAELIKSPNWTAGQWYDFACIYAVASGKMADQKQEYADRAMELLQKAMAAGYRDGEHIAKDKDLDALRGRADFKKLIADLEKMKP